MEAFLLISHVCLYIFSDCSVESDYYYLLALTETCTETVGSSH
jgi:hypothetical protein